MPRSSYLMPPRTAVPPLSAKAANHNKRPRQPAAPQPPVAPVPTLPPLGTEAAPAELRARAEMLLRVVADADALAVYAPGFERRGAALSVLAMRPAVDELGRAVSDALAPLHLRAEASGGVLDERGALGARVLGAAREMHRECTRRVAAAEVALAGNIPERIGIMLARLKAELAAQELRRDEAQAVLTRAAQQARGARQMPWLHLRQTPTCKVDLARAELADALQRLAALHATRGRLNAAIASATWQELEDLNLD